ncbi:glycosyltransferase family 2 protein [Phialemonium atrogriseum]|uniref:dolichyl-phosphate beta-glucosyltransferase n=1 Tax=Phialemonium atrogriseum TaxID=1093897 RepID=A0AAJ0C7D3_9PEZI|nr:glycosyltransferase family 2 protein [Phialemonium atrogriseum]KAK1771316.1 glycosyltransferase family 2 protein [Phialemonium atrogriseum]
MANFWSLPQALAGSLLDFVIETPFHLLTLILAALGVLGLFFAYIVLHLVAPKPRPVLPSEKKYLATNPDGTKSSPRQLPCWYDRWLAERHLIETRPDGPDGFPVPETCAIEPPEVEVSVIIPAYNEADRILPTLEEMVAYLDQRFGRPNPGGLAPPAGKGKKKMASPTTPHRLVFKSHPAEKPVSGYEIIIVDDESKDRTVEVALEFSRKHGLQDILRVVSLERNRGKGGAVTHGFRHARGEYVLFADADGASKFSDLGKLIEGCEDVVDGSNKGVAIGSRAHLVGSEAVVKRSAIRNFLMRSFHFILMILTPPATSRIRDTQCGFKLFSRASLPHIIPYMHTEGWIFDIEMLMLAESAPATPVLASDGTVIGTSYGIKVAEVPIEWHEVDGSKMSLVQDSIKMALGLAVLRASWMMGVYRRRLT